jgi:xylose isomerase
MSLSNRPRYATRLNAFKTKSDTVAEMIAKVAAVGGLNAADLNYPDHFDHHSPREVSRILSDHGLALNGLAMRYYTDPGFRLGAFTHPDRKVRRAAIDLTKSGIDAAAEMGAPLMTLWLGQDGFDYSFQADYARMWEDTIAAISEVADHNPNVDISIEYKPNEPRAHVLLPDMATTLLALSEVGRVNTGVTLDFCHMLFAGEMPAKAAMLAARSSRVLGVHLNDGYGKRDDGLIAGSVHPVQTVELFFTLMQAGYDGAIYFDTFPDHGGTNPLEEARVNIASLAENTDLAAAQVAQDAARATRIVTAAIYGLPG